MKVYIMTEATLFGPEKYIGVKSTFKKAEKTLREIALHMRKTEDIRKGTTAYFSDASNTRILFIHEEELDA